MSTSNFGVSRFEPSTIYAPVTFKGAVTMDNVTSLNAGNSQLVLTSNHSVKFAGSLEQQDVTILEDSILTGANFMQHFNIEGNAVITLPDLKADGTLGVPNGMRMTFFVSSNDNLIFKTSLASNANIRVIKTYCTFAGIASVIPFLLSPDEQSEPYTQNSFCYVTSANDMWVIAVTGTDIPIS
jgi:hypothetical protein